jgi:hypothetical protein
MLFLITSLSAQKKPVEAPACRYEEIFRIWDQYPGIFPHIPLSDTGAEVCVDAHIPAYPFDREAASLTWDKGRHPDTNCRYEEIFRIQTWKNSFHSMLVPENGGELKQSNSPKILLLGHE